MAFPKMTALGNAEKLTARIEQLGIRLPFRESLAPAGESPLASPLEWPGGVIGNRFAILPMEGWDGTTDGLPTDLTRRRWRNFGRSGAKLIWGGEACAVRPDGRANPNQLMLLDSTASQIESLREELVAAHVEEFGTTSGLLVGLQLTHSGRFARPNDKKRLEPMTMYRRVSLDAKAGVTDDSRLMSDDDLRRLIDDFVAAARRAHQIGFEFVDVKHCHGYLGHEILSAYDRPGMYGGDLENRTRFLREIVEGIRSEAPGLHVGVRWSAFDFGPYEPGDDGVGVASDTFRGIAAGDRSMPFGGDRSSGGYDLTEPRDFLEIFEQLGLNLICTTAGSPYYNPHIQRPAFYPPSDGYQPPEDPLVGVARQIRATAELKRAFPGLTFVGSAYSYLQEWLPNVAEEVVATGMADSVGLGRMVLSYPTLPADVLAGRPMPRKLICRTFSDCTTAPRNGMVSGCFPLDEFYRDRPERDRLKRIKAGEA